MAKGALNVDKAIWELYEQIPYLLCEQPYGDKGRYITYYAEERLYLVFDLWYHGFFLVEADSPKNAIENVNCDRLKYVPKLDYGGFEMTKEQAIEEINKAFEPAFANYIITALTEGATVSDKSLKQQKPLEKFENVKDHICKLADDYKCWDNRLSHEESLELCNILKQQSDDCVSRKKVWYMITGGKYPNEDYEQFIDRLVKELDNMPPVTPTRNKPKEDITEDEVRINMLELAHQGSLNGLRRQTNECLKNAYNKGYEDGKKDFEVSNGQAEYNKGYNKGLEEFEKLYINEYDYKDFFKSYDNEDIQNWELYDLVAKYGAKKVVNDFNKWQEEKKKAEDDIRVGDEVTVTDSDTLAGYTFIVMQIIGKRVFGIREDWCLYENLNLEYLEKTGRHFDEVSQLLDKLRGEE